MKLEPSRDWAARVTVCLAAGGALMAMIVCFFIGFGLNTASGKEAIYVAVLLQALNMVIIRRHERRLAKANAFPPSSRQMTAVRLTALNLWRGGAVVLLTSVFLTAFGVPFANFWVKLTCYAGLALLYLGWIGSLLCYHRRHQAAVTYAREQALLQE